MTAPQPSNPASALAATVGRYFTVVSVVPSLFLIAFVVILAESTAEHGDPDFGRGLKSLTGLGLGGTFVLILAALSLGAVLHPLQYALVQFLEGYWVLGRGWTMLREDRIRYHLERRSRLDASIVAQAQTLGLVENEDGTTPPPLTLSAWQLAFHTSEKVAAERLRAMYPAEDAEVMPTRLGNVLRTAETTAGKAVGMNIIDFAPHLMMVARREHVDYVNDQRTAFDLAIRTCLVCILGFASTIFFLWPHGLWLLIATIPLGLAWLCYHGSVTAAREYGAALRMLFDLNRFALYERMRLPIPSTTDGERVTVNLLTALSSRPETEGSVRYRHPPSPPPPAAPT